MEEYNYHTKRRARPGRGKTSQQAPNCVLGDDFGDGFSGGKAKAKAKAKSIVHQAVYSTSVPHAPPVIARSRPRYKEGTALICTDSDSADELNICASQSETQSRRAGSHIHQPLSYPPERKQPAERKERSILHSPARDARAGARAIGKRREYRAAKGVPSKERDSQLNALVPGRTVSSSKSSLHYPRSPLPTQRASRAVTHLVALTSSNNVLRQKPLLSDPRSPSTAGDYLSFAELVQPKKLLMTHEDESSLPPGRTGSPKQEDDLTMNRSISEKSYKEPLPTSRKRKGIISSTSTTYSSTGGTNVSTRSGRKRFEGNGECSSYQMGVPWADVVNLPSSPALATPISQSTRTSKSSQDSSTFPMHFTPDLRMKKRTTLESGSRRSPKRKRSSMKEVPDVIDEGGAADTTMSYTQIIQENDIDPTTLCPFCDDPLPANPSRKLCSQLAHFRATCEIDSRWGNSMGLTAPVNVFVAFCALHKAETKVIPQGLKYGWPQKINFKAMARRVRKLEGTLREVIEDPDGRGAMFFGPLKEAAAKYGIGAVTGSKGSWNSFEGAHAGYYGEKGVVVISHILFDLFPSIPGNTVQPFDGDFFRSHVLVPEAALLLIREDLSNQPKWAGKIVPRDVAFKILQKSAAYGKAMFAEEDGTAGVADHAVRQRAKVRRKEIEQEEQQEMVEEIKRQKSSNGKVGKALGKIAVFGDDLVELSSSDREDSTKEDRYVYSPATVEEANQARRRQTRQGMR